MAPGTILFQQIYINKSYRWRGKVVRTQTQRNIKKKKIIKKILEEILSMSNKVVRNLVNKILVYSAKKNKVNRPLLYSTL